MSQLDSRLGLTIPAWTHVCDTLAARGDNDALAKMLRVSSQMFDIAHPVLYRRPAINELKIESFILGLRPFLRTGLRFPPSKRRRLGPPISSHRSNRQTQARKLRLLAKVRELCLRERPFNRMKRYNQIDRHVLILRWCLHNATQPRFTHSPETAEKVILPALRRIDYTGDIQNESVAHRLRIAIHLEPVSSAVLSRVSNPNHKITHTSPSPLWDICIRIEPLADPAQLQYAPESEFEGIVAVRRWLECLAARKAICNLSIRSEDPTLLFPKEIPRYLGTLQLYVVKPRVRATTADIEHRAEKYSGILKGLLRMISAATIYGLRIHLFDANLGPKTTSGVSLRRMVIEDLLEAPGIAHVILDGSNPAAEMSHAELGSQSALWLSPATGLCDFKPCLCTCNILQTTDFRSGDIFIFAPTPPSTPTGTSRSASATVTTSGRSSDSA